MFISQKYIVCTSTCISLILLYGARYAVPITIPHVIHVKGNRRFSSKDVCKDAIHLSNTDEMINDIYLEWSPSELFYVFSAFYLGYMLSHLPSGILCDLYGAKYILCASLLGCAVINLITTYTLKLSWFYSALTQGLQGTMQGIAMPAILSLMARSVPYDHTTWFVSYGYSGGSVGSLLTGVLSTYFIKIRKWEGLFYFWAGVTIVCCIPFMIFVYPTPTAHSLVKEQGETMLMRELEVVPKKIPLKAIVYDSAVWASVAGHIGHTYLLFTFDTYLKGILTQIVGIRSKGVIFVIIYSFRWISIIISGYIGDRLIRRGRVPTIYLRCIFCAIGNIFPSIIVLSTLYMGCNKVLIVGCLSIANICKGTIFASTKCNILDLTRHYAGVVQGIQNGIGAVVGMITPQIIGKIVQQQLIEEWRQMFWLTFGVCSFTSTYFFIYCKGERAEWDMIEEDNERISEDSDL